MTGRHAAVRPRRLPTTTQTLTLTLLVPALVCGAALPARASEPAPTTPPVTAPVRKLPPQTFNVLAAFTAQTISRDVITVTAPPPPPPPPVVQPAVTPTAVNPHPAAVPLPAVPADSIIATAMQYIGVPYVFGGTTPAGFDCSGLVQYVYAQHGIHLPRLVSGQRGAGTVIPFEQAQPGDLIVFPDNSHIMLWVGDGYVLDAPDVGRAVSIRKLWTNDIIVVRIGQ